MVVEERPGAALEKAATAVEGPDWFGEELDEVRARGCELVVDCPGGGEDVAASLCGAFSGLEGENVAESVCVEGLFWVSHRSLLGCRFVGAYRCTRRVSGWPVLLRSLGPLCVPDVHFSSFVSI